MGLVSTQYCTEKLSELTLSTAQLAALPDLIDAATTAIQTWCGGRVFARSSFDEQYTPGWDGSLTLKQCPVNQITRIATTLTPAITISNTDGSTNQRATVRFAYAATADYTTGGSPTGLELSRVASAVSASDTVLFADYATVTALADAITALGHGWAANLVDDYALWPSTDLVDDSGSPTAFGYGCELKLYAEDLGSRDYQLDRGPGIIRLRRWPRIGRGYFADPWIWAAPGTEDWGTVRVVYDAGFQTVPTDVQAACVETVKKFVTGLPTDTQLQSEKAGQYGFTLSSDINELGTQIPPSAKRLLAPYRYHNA